MANLTFDPKTQIPDLSGKVFLVTGGTAGLGKETILSLITHSPALIYFTGRNAKAADAVIDAAKAAWASVSKDTSSAPGITFLPCDQTSLSSVKSCCDSLLAQTQRLDVLICNAGVMAVPAGLTSDGFENQFGINHLAHALIVTSLLPLMRRSSPSPRVVFLTSLGYQISSGIDLSTIRTEQSSFFGRWLRYGHSKLANVLYARALSRHETAEHDSKVTFAVIHPGVAYTGLVNSLGFVDRWFIWFTNIGKIIQPDQAAYNSLWASAVAESKDLSVDYVYEPVGVPGKLNAAASNDTAADELWKFTEDVLAKYT